ncbi:hypothetical protein [Paracoccus seriniphilus]|uniref:Uncharacterized protein n=1 Tax=Paracoccus seriniphilus TaxID=184748 RepID=A0A239PN38_9RHOB|nr:hypothetical protein [Paracoccus seriniphilus]WCR15032.1 hypothetical protein JHW44_06335 [Paracoccus seriniphilus]SNT71528.1 hypothetical protein SAMN05444959_10236 [Paracoccus seriniphilus]
MIGFTLLADILFIGLGLFAPELPQMVESAGRMSGEDVTVEARLVPNAPLKYHWMNAASGPDKDPRELLFSGQVDQVLMTEAMPLIENLEVHDSIDYAIRFRDLALRHNPDAETYLYESWPTLKPGQKQEWRHAVAAGGLFWRAMVKTVNEQSLAGPAGAPMRLIPLAQGLLALDDAISAGGVPGLEDFEQVFTDGQHLNGRGSYFAAMLLHAALTDEDPTGLPVWLGRNRPATLDEAITTPMAEAMQKIARRVVQEQKEPVTGFAAALRRAEAVVRETRNDSSPQSLWQDPNASYLTGIERRGVAFNLSEVNDWSAEQPFLDVFKTARPWIGHLPGQWGGFDAPKLHDAGYLDEDGWPLMIPPEVTHLSTLILSDLNEKMISMAGRYVLRYQGEGRLELEGRARNVTYEPGRVTFDYQPGPGSVLIHLREINPDNPVRDISVVRQDRIALADAGRLFNPDFLARLRGAEVLRFMGWMRTNNSTVSNVEELPEEEDYIWSTRRGVPPEVMVALANELDLDPWFTLPHLADDELVHEYARRVRDNLEPGRRAWVEFSNEVWNGAFDQHQWAERKAIEEWGAEGAAMQYGAFRAAQVADIWSEEFAPSAAGRLVRVIGTFTGWPGAEDDMLMAPAWKEADPENWHPLAGHFDAYAVTGYFYANLENPERLALLQKTLEDSWAEARRRGQAEGLRDADLDAFVQEHRFDLAIGRAIADLHAGGLSDQPEGTVQWVIDTLFRHHAAAARKYGLDLVMYEGGSHVVASGALSEDEELTSFLIALNYSPGMGELYRHLMKGWRQYSDQPFNFYTAIDGPSRYGSWGTLRFLDDMNARWRAVSEAEE